MKDKISKVLAVFIVMYFTGISLSFAEGLQSIGFFSGYMEGELKSRTDDYKVIPMMVTLGFDLRPLAEKFGIETKGILEFQLEPFISPIFSPESNLELGLGMMFKYAFPLTDSFMPYLKVGSGPMYFTLQTQEQSTQFNFATSGCAGFSWFFKEDVSLDCEYRFRHMSNASIKHPNNGINTETILVGLTFRFE